MTFRKWRKFFAPQGLKCSERNWFVITISPWFDSEERSKNVRIPTSSSLNLLCWACKLLLFSVTESCPTFCDCSPPRFSVHGISQGRILEWVAMPSSRDLPDSRIPPVSPALAVGFFTTELPRKPRPADIQLKELVNSLHHSQSPNRLGPESFDYGTFWFAGIIRTHESVWVISGENLKLYLTRIKTMWDLWQV